MTIEHTKHKHGSVASKLTECPVDGCHEKFGEPVGLKRRSHLLNDHDPSDFNLTDD